MRKPRDFAAGSVAVHDFLLRRADDHRFGLSHGGERFGAVAGGNRLFHFADGTAQARMPRPIDGGAADGLSCSFSGGLCVGHYGTLVL